MNDKQKAAILRAADWLEANPGKHVMYTLATDKDGTRTNPLLFDAVCFCALGRIAYELRTELRKDAQNVRHPFHVDHTAISLAAGIAGEAELIWDTNDTTPDPMSDAFVRIGSKFRRQGNPAVIPLLRKLVA